MRFSQKLTQHLAPFYGDDLLIQAEDIRDNSADIAEVQAAASYLTINEVRERYFHIEPIADGDRLPATAPTPSIAPPTLPLPPPR